MSAWGQRSRIELCRAASHLARKILFPFAVFHFSVWILDARVIRFSKDKAALSTSCPSDLLPRTPLGTPDLLLAGQRP